VGQIADNAAAPRRHDLMQFPRSGIREIVELVRGRRDIIPLHSGEPDHAVPPHIFDAVARVATNPARYGPGAGVPELRQAAATKLRSVNGIATTTDNVTITHGAVQGCAALFGALLSEGDEALVPGISYPNYALLAGMRGATIRRYTLDRTDGYRPDLDHVAALMSPRTKIVVVNSPANPTGAVLDPPTVAALVDLVERHDVLLLSDEAYDEIYFEDRPASPAALSADNVITLCSLSKTYAMTGWRVGYVHAPSWLSGTLARVQESTLGGVSTVTQVAALAALTGPQDGVDVMRQRYRHRALRVIDRVATVAPTFQPPGGGLFAMAPVPPGVSSSRDAAFELIEDGVATVPGSAFGPDGEGLLRVSICLPDALLEAGLTRYTDWFRGHL
jgi:aspartate aminotransferase